VKAKLPNCHHYLITAFFRVPIRKADTSLFPPILRPEILAAARRPGDHILVYQTADAEGALAEALRKTGRECRIYGMRRNLEADKVEGNLRFRPFSEATFIDDLASCRAVIASAGFTLMGEAVYLQKPMLAVPLQRQFEQYLNGRYLQREGYGMTAEDAGQLALLPTFLARLPEFEANLVRYQQDGNREILLAIDEQLSRAPGL
jgi:uncharacterized protein (TIGR00661 family)